PAGTPRPVVDRLNVAHRYALADAKVKKTFAEGGMDAFPPEQETPEAATALLKSEIKLWGDVIRANNISAQFGSSAVPESEIRTVNRLPRLRTSESNGARRYTALTFFGDQP